LGFLIGQKRSMILCSKV